MNFSSLFFVFLVLILSACTENNINSLAMTCHIQKKAQGCSGVPILSNGYLTFMSNQKFKLTGQYSACYQEEFVIIQGKYTSTDFGEGMNIELLATDIEGLSSSKFPSTVAVITLEKSSLNGEFRDVWATIRAPESNERFTVEVNCKPE